MPTVVNRHHFGVRKGRPPLPTPNIYVGRGTPLGNPFTLADLRPGEDRLVILQRYRQWLWARLLEHDVKVLEWMRRIRPETHLVCSCAPQPCHADVIVKAWEWLQARNFEPPTREIASGDRVAASGRGAR